MTHFNLNARSDEERCKDRGESFERQTCLYLEWEGDQMRTAHGCEGRIGVIDGKISVQRRTLPQSCNDMTIGAPHAPPGMY